jgi:hypothetical protein
VGRQRPAHRARRRGDLQRFAPGARHPERVLAVPGDLSRLRCHRCHVPRTARVPALRVQRVGRVGDHARGRRHAGPVPGALRGHQVPDAVRLGGGRGPARADRRARRLRGHRPGVGHQARARRAREPGRGPCPGAQVDGHPPGQPRVRVPAAHAHRADRGRAGRRAGRLGRPGQQPGLRRHPGPDRVPVPGRAAGAVIGRGTTAAGPWLGRRVRVDGNRAVRVAAKGRRPRGRVRDDRQQRDHRRGRALSLTRSLSRGGPSGSARCLPTIRCSAPASSLGCRPTRCHRRRAAGAGC